MANSMKTIVTGNVVDIEFDAATDWDFSARMPEPIKNSPNGIFIESIGFSPSHRNDKLIVRNGAVGAARIFDPGICANTSDAKIKYFDSDPNMYKPYVDISECTVNSPDYARLTITMR